MQDYKERALRMMQRAGLVLVLGLLSFCAPRANATPFTDHFDVLIADLHGRADALSSSTDKVGKKQFKTIQSALKTLEGKSSTSLATDIKNLGGVAKTLVKAFPGDFLGGTFSTDLDAALGGLVDDVRASANTTQTTLEGLADSTCKSKTLITVFASKNLCDEALAATDFASASKLLGTAVKDTVKAGIAAGKCNSGGGGGGGGGGNAGDSVTARISGSFSANLSASGAEFTSALYSSTLNMLSFSGADILGAATIAVAVADVTGPGTYSVANVCSVGDLRNHINYGSYPGTDSLSTGTITFTTFDLAQQKASGTFAFTAPQVQPAGSGSVTVTQGTFNFSKITTIP